MGPNDLPNDGARFGEQDFVDDDLWLSPELDYGADEGDEWDDREIDERKIREHE